MRRNQRERLARRAEYLKAHPTTSKDKLIGTIEGLRGTFTYTQANKADFHDEAHVSRHEAAHAVAAWMQGMPIHCMQFNDESTKDSDYVPANVRAVHQASTATGIPLPEMQATSPGERWVHAKRHAFVTLAGPLGGGDTYSDNPLRRHESDLHLGQAAAKFTTITGCTDEIGLEACRSLIDVVYDAFKDPAIQGVVGWLANALVKHRKLSGDEIVGIIEQAYPVFKIAVEARSAAAAGK